jgi:hypothetical protein
VPPGLSPLCLSQRPRSLDWFFPASLPGVSSNGHSRVPIPLPWPPGVIPTLTWVRTTLGALCPQGPRWPPLDP